MSSDEKDKQRSRVAWTYAEFKRARNYERIRRLSTIEAVKTEELRELRQRIRRLKKEIKTLRN